ncbi:ComEC/Rec2 family competence protein [Geitlerinema splendidum]|nr:ComEC/Rec2 family competence protein [Geitlerinema splendidum]
MTPVSAAILCIAYISGLIAASVAWGGYVGLAGGLLAAVGVKQIWRTGPKRWVWVTAGIIWFFASLYLQWRSPLPQANDISRFISTETQTQVVQVEGVLTREPRLTRSGRSQFFLQANQLSQANATQSVTGQVYITVPLLQATGLHQGQTVRVTGRLYLPQPAANPGAFDFQAYLKKSGVFAGLVGRQVEPLEPPPQWGWWRIRQVIVRSHLQGLGIPTGPLVSSMVMGRQAVDLSYPIRDRFIQVGLAHILAASGFHVSLLLGLVLVLTRRLSSRLQFSVGLATLLVFVGLTGLQPSVARAALMGFGTLIALVLDRQVKPLGSLLLTATLLLLFNPLWIGELGFQLSFLATLGLVVTAPAIVQRLDWVPPAIATLIAVPLAASIWTLPLLLYTFGLVSPYSILVNILTSPLVSLITLGGFISALVAIFWSAGGSLLASLLYYPTHLLIEIVQFFATLPGNTVAVGSISLLQFLGLYGLIGSVWLFAQENRPVYPVWLKKQSWSVATATAIALIIIPIWQTQQQLLRVTVLATGQTPVMVIQDRGLVGLINSGDEDTAQYTILPFLQKQGINRLDWAIALSPKPENRRGWLPILAKLPIKSFYTLDGESPEEPLLTAAVQQRRGSYQNLPFDRPLTLGSNQIQPLNPNIPGLLLTVGSTEQNWLVLENLTFPGGNLSLPTARVLWWTGEPVNPSVLEQIQPQFAIASTYKLDPQLESVLTQNKIQTYQTYRDGAIQWTPKQEFTTQLELDDREADLT